MEGLLGFVVCPTSELEVGIFYSGERLEWVELWKRGDQ